MLEDAARPCSRGLSRARTGAQFKCEVCSEAPAGLGIRTLKPQPPARRLQNDSKETIAALEMTPRQKGSPVTTELPEDSEVIRDVSQSGPGIKLLGYIFPAAEQRSGQRG